MPVQSTLRFKNPTKPFVVGGNKVVLLKEGLSIDNLVVTEDRVVLIMTEQELLSTRRIMKKLENIENYHRFFVEPPYRDVIKVSAQDISMLRRLIGNSYEHILRKENLVAVMMETVSRAGYEKSDKYHFKRTTTHFVSFKTKNWIFFT